MNNNSVCRLFGTLCNEFNHGLCVLQETVIEQDGMCDGVVAAACFRTLAKLTAVGFVANFNKLR